MNTDTPSLSLAFAFPLLFFFFHHYSVLEDPLISSRVKLVFLFINTASMAQYGLMLFTLFYLIFFFFK